MEFDDPIRATIVGGPIIMRDYDYLQLEQPHTAVFQDGTTIDLPPGVKLIRHGAGEGVKQSSGLASRGAANRPPAA